MPKIIDDTGIVNSASGEGLLVREVAGAVSLVVFGGFLVLALSS